MRYIEKFHSRAFNDNLHDAYFVDCGGSGYPWYQPEIGEVIEAAYPTLRTTTDQADPGLTHTTAISDKTGLINMKNNLAGNYYLTADIDCSGGAWTRIGNTVTPFTGTFDGCGYTISNLTITASNLTQGLFGTIRDPAKIANVTLTNVSISSGSSKVGALVGWAQTTGSGLILIQNCSSSGTIAGTSYYLGGLIGQVSSDGSEYVYVYDCSSSVVITGSGSGANYIGGLIGYSDISIVSNCYATGNVTSPNLGIGGFVGECGTSEGKYNTFTYCYATGNVTAQRQSGGFVGLSNVSDVFQKCYATGDVVSSGASSSKGRVGGFVGTDGGSDYTDCYAWGDITNSDDSGEVGGFAGLNQVNATFTNCYSIGLVTGPGTPGGFIESAIEGTTFTQCFWDTTTSATAVSDGGAGHDTTWMQTKSNYEDAGWDLDTIWYIPVATEGQEEAWGDTPTGYSHLIGETVNILADGVKQPQQTVDVNGDIDDTEFSDATDIIVGLPITYKLIPQEMNYGDLAFILRKNIRGLKLDLFKSLDGRYGPNINSTDKIDYTYENYDSGPVLFTGNIELPFDGTYDNAGDIIIWDDGPLPFTVLGMAVNIEVED